MFGTISEDDAILAFHVDRQTEIDLLAHDAERLAVLLGVGIIQLRKSRRARAESPSR